MSENVQAKPVKSCPVERRFIIYAGVILVIFLLGFVSMSLKARTANSSLFETEHQLMLVSMQPQKSQGAV